MDYRDITKKSEQWFIVVFYRRQEEGLWRVIMGEREGLVEQGVNFRAIVFVSYLLFELISKYLLSFDADIYSQNEGSFYS